jgi:hypothetical protein
MDTWKRITAVIVLLVPISLIVYDTLIDLLVGKQATITYVVQQAALKYGEIPYVVGGLMTWLWLHLFFEIVIRGK